MDISTKLVEIIKKQTPADQNSVDLLMEILSINKEVAYRRLRGEMSFTLQEAALIAKHLKISLDEILINDKKNGSKVIAIKADDSQSKSAGYFNSTDKFLESLITIQLQPHSMYYFTTNTFPLSHIYKYPTLSKFRIFIQNYLFRKEISLKKFSEFTISPEIRTTEIAYAKEVQQVPITCIWLKTLFVPFVTEIQYFSGIGLLSKEDINILKEEAYALLNDLEEDVSCGKSKLGAPLSVYLSNGFFDNNCIYLETPTLKSGSIKVFGFNIYSLTEPELCDDMKKWILSLMKYSILISNSGIIDRVQFFKQQRNLLDNC